MTGGSKMNRASAFIWHTTFLIIPTKLVDSVTIHAHMHLFSHSATNLHHRQIHKIIRNPNLTNTCDMLRTTNTCCLWKLPKTRENKCAACFNSQEVVLEVDVHKHTFSSNIAVTSFSANDSCCCRN